MHSFRLRYVALGLLVYIQSALSSRTCGTDFDDPASSAVAADTVLLATAVRAAGGGAGAGAGAGGNPPRVAVRFRVERVYKGNIPAADVGDGGGRRKPTLVVGSFATRPNRERCVAPMVESGRRYIVFLGGDDDDDDVRTSRRLQRRRQTSGSVPRRRRRMRISAFPVPAADDVIDTVELYTNCSNRCRKYLVLR